MNPIRILIVEKQQLVADALAALLGMQQDMVVIGNFRSVADSTPSALELNPDILILHFRFEDGIAADASKAISQARSEARVVFLTNDESDSVLLAAIEAGVSAVIYMSTPASEVIDAIRTVAEGGSLIPPHTIAKLINNRRWTDHVRDSLTGREADILQLMSEGMANREIAIRLGIGYSTVRSHVRSLSGKLAAHSKLEVVVKAQQLRLVERQSATRMAIA